MLPFILGAIARKSVKRAVFRKPNRNTKAGAEGQDGGALNGEYWPYDETMESRNASESIHRKTAQKEKVEKNRDKTIASATIGKWRDTKESFNKGRQKARYAKDVVSDKVSKYGGSQAMSGFNFLTGNNIVGNTFAAIGDLALGKKPQWMRNEDKVATKQAKAYMKLNKMAYNKNDPESMAKYQEVKDSLKFDNAMGTNFTQTQLGGTTQSKGIMGLFKRDIQGKGLLSVGGVSSLGQSGFSGGGGMASLGMGGGGGAGLAAALKGSMGGVQKVALVNSEGVAQIVSASKDIEGAVEESGNTITRTISGSSALLQGSDGKFKEGNVGGKSAIIKEIKGASDKLEAVVSSNKQLSVSFDNTPVVSNLERISHNTDPIVVGGDNEILVMSVKEGHSYAKQQNILVEGSNKYLAYIAKRLGLKPEERAPRRGKALLGMAVVGAVGTGIEAGKNAMDEHMPGITDKMTKMYDWMMDKLTPIFNYLAEKITPVFEAISKAWDSFTNSAFFKSMTSLLDLFKEKLKEEIGNKEGIFANIASGFSTLFESIKMLFSEGFMKDVVDLFKSAGRLVWEIVKRVGIIAQVFIKVLQPVFKVMSISLQLAVKAVRKVIDGIVWLFEVTQPIWKAIMLVATSLVDIINSVIDGIKNSWFGEMFGVSDRKKVRMEVDDDGQLVKPMERTANAVEAGNKQREQIQKRNEDIAARESQKDAKYREEQLKLQKENVAITKAIQLTAAQEAELRDTAEKMNLFEKEYKKIDAKANEIKMVSDTVAEIAVVDPADIVLAGKSEEEKKALQNKRLEEIRETLLTQINSITRDAGEDSQYVTKDKKFVLAEVGTELFDTTLKVDREEYYRILADEIEPDNNLVGVFKNLRGKKYAEELGGTDDVLAINANIINKVMDAAIKDGWNVGRTDIAKGALELNKSLYKIGEEQLLSQKQEVNQKAYEKTESIKQKQKEADAKLSLDIMEGRVGETKEYAENRLIALKKDFDEFGKEDFIKLRGEDVYEEIKDKLDVVDITAAVDTSRDVLRHAADTTNEKLDDINRSIKDLKGDSVISIGKGTFSESRLGSMFKRDDKPTVVEIDTKEEANKIVSQEIGKPSVARVVLDKITGKREVTNIEPRHMAVGVADEQGLEREVVQATARTEMAKLKYKQILNVNNVGQQQQAPVPNTTVQPNSTSSVTNITPQTDESIHFQSDVVSMIAAGIIGQSLV